MGTIVSLTGFYIWILARLRHLRYINFPHWKPN